MDVAPRRFKIVPTDRDVHVPVDFRNAFRWLRANVSRWICS
ncbi:hypothetical protein [Sphingomonas sp. UYEF23]